MFLCRVTYHAVCLDGQTFERLVATTEPAGRRGRRGFARPTTPSPIRARTTARRPGVSRRWSGSWPTGSRDSPSPRPGRLLVAGCGTGAEAFALSRRFPHAEIVAVDFSPRSIAIARQYQQGVRNRGNIRFVVADLSTRGLNRLTGVDFDIVFCHGVLGYVPGAGSTLRNLSRCLSPDGALYLGVNGTRHVSVGLRAVLPTFGLDVSRFAEGPQAREVLSLCDAILGHRHPEERVATRPAAYLASDVFGELIQNRPAIDVGSGRADRWPALSEQPVGASRAATPRRAGSLRTAAAAVACARLPPTRRASPGSVSHAPLHSPTCRQSAMEQASRGRGLASSVDGALSSPASPICVCLGRQARDARLPCHEHSDSMADELVAASLAARSRRHAVRATDSWTGRRPGPDPRRVAVPLRTAPAGRCRHAATRSGRRGQLAAGY